MPILSKNQKINGYTVVFLVKQGMCAETYRVKDGLGNNLFLKLINVQNYIIRNLMMMVMYWNYRLPSN